MGAYGKAVGVMFKRPFIILFFGLITLIISIINYFNPIFDILLGFGTLLQGDIFESLVSFIQVIINPDILIRGSSFILGFLIMGAIMVGLIFSGYFNIINNALDRKPKFKGEFAAGLKKYFFKTAFVSFRVLLFGFIFAIISLIAMVPSAIITRIAFSGKSEFFILAAILDIMTIGVLFFGYMFFRVYIFFWYPAVFNVERKAFTVGKRTVDNHFWSIVGRFIVFDIVFVIFQSGLAYIGYLTSQQSVAGSLSGISLLVVDWIFKTFFFASFITYIFSAFKMYGDE